MKTAVLLLAVVIGAAFAVVYEAPVHRIESLREKLVRQGKYAEYVKAKKELRQRRQEKITGTQVAYDYDDVSSIVPFLNNSVNFIELKMDAHLNLSKAFFQSALYYLNPFIFTGSHRITRLD